MKIKPAYYTGTHIYSFRSGKPGEIIGVKMVVTDGLGISSLCFHVRYPDGIEDYSPISDAQNYQITSE